MIKVVSNASPLIFLSKLGELDLLSRCFEDVHIPRAVKAEVGDLVLPGFIQITAISEFGKHYVGGALGVLHAGELEAIQLTEEINADIVILDDLRARQRAKHKNLMVIGTLGVLQLAYTKKLLSREQLMSHFDALVNQHGMWLSDKMLRKLKELN